MKYLLILIVLLTYLSSPAQFQVADSLVQAGKYQLAIEEYEKIPDSEFKLAKAYVQLGDVYAALATYEKGFKKDSISTTPRFEYARLALRNNDPVTAFGMFDALIKEVPDNASYRYYLGQALVDLSNDAGAISAFAKAVSLNKSYRAARIEWIKLLIKNRRFNDAVITAQPALELYPNDIKINSLIAQAYLGAKRYDKAIEHFELLFKLGNDTDFNRKNLAWSYFNDQQWQLAIENYEKYNRDYEDKNSLIYFIMSKAYLQLDQLEQAQNHIEQSIQFKTPELHQEYLQLATVYVRLGDFKNAFYATKKAKNEKPEDDVLGYQYAIAADQYFADKEKKLSYYEEFIEQYPSSRYQEMANARAKDLRKEIFLSAKK